MLKNLFLNTSAMLWDADSDAKAVLRKQIASGTNVTAKSDNEPKEKIVAEEVEEEKVEENEEDNENEDNENEEGEDEPELDEDGNPKLDDDGNPILKKKEETAEEKTAREAKETADDKERRKQERIQKRIDKAVAGQRIAEAELVRIKALLDAKPDDQKLTKEEVEARAEAIANEKIATAELNRLQKEFEKNCDKIQDEAVKLDPAFNTKVKELADELGPLPNKMLNILFEFDNGAAVLKYLVDDIDEAEKIYELQNNPAKLGITLSKISDKLAEAAKPKKKEISKVPDPIKPVNGGRVQSTQITSNDTKPENMENYIRKRAAQRDAQKKARGY